MEKDSNAVLLAAWQQYQTLIRDNRETEGKVRSLYYTVVTAVFAYSYVEGQPLLYYLIPFVGVLFFFLEAGYRRIQLQYIDKSLEIEQSLSDILVGEQKPQLPDGGVNTSLDVPQLKDWYRLLGVSRFLFWFPYLIISAMAWFLAWGGVVAA